MGSKRKKWEQVCGKRRSVFAEAQSVTAWYHDADMGAAVFAGPDRKWRNLRHVSHAFFHGDKGRKDTTRPEAHDGGQTADCVLTDRDHFVSKNATPTMVNSTGMKTRKKW